MPKRTSKILSRKISLDRDRAQRQDTNAKMFPSGAARPLMRANNVSRKFEGPHTVRRPDRKKVSVYNLFRKPCLVGLLFWRLMRACTVRYKFAVLSLSPRQPGHPILFCLRLSSSPVVIHDEVAFVPRQWSRLRCGNFNN